MTAIQTPPVSLVDVLAVENLNAAWAQVKANGGAAKVDGRTAAQTAERIVAHKDQLLNQRRAGDYRSAAVKAVDRPQGQWR